MKIIAHGVKTWQEAQKAIGAGVDFLEIDVSKPFLRRKFIIQHSRFWGKSGKYGGIWAWTVNDLSVAKKLKTLGVDGIITDNWQGFLKYEYIRMH